MKKNNMATIQYQLLHHPCIFLLNCRYWINRFPRMVRGLLWVLWEHRHLINRIITNIFLAITASAMVGAFIIGFFFMFIVFG